MMFHREGNFMELIISSGSHFFGIDVFETKELGRFEFVQSLGSLPLAGVNTSQMSPNIRGNRVQSLRGLQT